MSSEAGPTSAGIRFVVRGRVQGVGFRWWTERQAQQLGLTGTVSNLPDGTVEVLAFGPPDRIQQLQASLQEGPPSSHVSDVAAQPLELGHAPPADFRIV